MTDNGYDTLQMVITELEVVMEQYERTVPPELISRLNHAQHLLNELRIECSGDNGR